MQISSIEQSLNPYLPEPIVCVLSATAHIISSIAHAIFDMIKSFYNAVSDFVTRDLISQENHETSCEPTQVNPATSNRETHEVDATTTSQSETPEEITTNSPSPIPPHDPTTDVSDEVVRSADEVVRSADAVAHDRLIGPDSDEDDSDDVLQAVLASSGREYRQQQEQLHEQRLQEGRLLQEQEAQAREQEAQAELDLAQAVEASRRDAPREPITLSSENYDEYFGELLKVNTLSIDTATLSKEQIRELVEPIKGVRDEFPEKSLLNITILYSDGRCELFDMNDDTRADRLYNKLTRWHAY